MQGGKIEGKQLNITKPLATLLREHNKYIANAPVFTQYIIWTYTLGSQAINRELAGIPYAPKKQQEWAFNFLNNFKQYGGWNEVSKVYKNAIYYEFKKLFTYPKEYLKLPYEKRQETAIFMISTYADEFQHIINNAPRTTGDIIVYKASTPYDPRLTGESFPISLMQKPFNSTTYDPWFDFNAFLGSNDDTCCLWQILIPKGSVCLNIPFSYQAYSTEREIVLPFGCDLIVKGAVPVDMSYYNDRDAPMKTQLTNPEPTIGELYRHDNWVPREIKTRTMRMLIADYQYEYEEDEYYDKEIGYY